MADSSLGNLDWPWLHLNILCGVLGPGHFFMVKALINTEGRYWGLRVSAEGLSGLIGGY